LIDAAVDYLTDHDYDQLTEDWAEQAFADLARSIRACDRWWYPVLEQWEELGQGFNNAEKQQRAMLALLDSLKAFNGGSLPDVDSLRTLDGSLPDFANP